MPPPTDKTWPAFERAIPALSPAMPAETASMANRTIRPMNALEEALMGQEALAITHPNGTIAYNRAAAERAGTNPDELMAHELTHVGQINKRGLLGQLAAMLTQTQPYMERPDERAAYDAEAKVGRRTRDINLPAEKNK